MNQLSFDRQIHIVAALTEGNSIRSTERLCGAHRDTVMNLGLTMGEACDRLHDILVRDVQVGRLELDEIWAFIYKKQRRLTDRDQAERGDSYTYIGLDAVKKAIISYRVGKRTAATTCAFAMDLRDRILNSPQITSDGYKEYVAAVERAFGPAISYAQLIKEYSSSLDDERRYSPPRCTGAKRVPISGYPIQEDICTSFVERENLTMRMSLRRFTRLTNAFSKRERNHAAAVALYVAHYNFCRVHETLRATPCMSLGVTNHVWSIAELMEAALSIAPPEETPPTPTVRMLPSPQPQHLALAVQP